MPLTVHAVDRPELAPFPMPDRFKYDIAYFMTPSGEHGAPKLERGEYWIALEQAQEWLDDGVVYVISPLDSSKQAEVEISDDQEAWLEWMVKHQLQHVRLETGAGSNKH